MSTEFRTQGRKTCNPVPDAVQEWCMNSAMPSPQCPECGGALAPAAAQGLCPRCLMAGAAQSSEPVNRAAPPTLGAVGAAFPHLEVQDIVGHGGMGAVYRVRQAKLDRLAALKLLPHTG